MRIVAAITRPGSEKVGEDLGTLAGIPPLGVPVRSDARQTLEENETDIVAVAVSTYLDQVMYDIYATVVRAGANVITLAEEMLYPFPTAGPRAEQLDELARRHGVTAPCPGSRYRADTEATRDTDHARHRHHVARLGSGRPRTRPDRVRADEAYASRKNRAYLRRRGIRAAINEWL
ncbi:oxidoreductase [Streptomyces bingchenggensis BCW-1]|uniref:Oxidoreductase n=1 Tax=Streptomyces bingchenggensis (strain BCW-1) TaxID=749414 RepID=D7CFD2_STRBB|nr:oxidoreductase [Streptomyces bingchenggensis BCW-1]